MIRSKPNNKNYDDNYDQIFGKKNEPLPKCLHSVTHKNGDLWECYHCGTQWSLDGTREIQK